MSHRFLAAVLVLCLAGTSGTSCLLTDPLGIPPAGTRVGAEVKPEIFDSVVVAFAQGASLFGSIVGIEQDVLAASLTAALLAENLIGLDDALYYDRGDVQACIDAIVGAGPFLVAGFLAERQDCPDAPAECVVDKTKLSGVAQKTAAFLPLIGCGDIARSGRFIHFFELQF